MKIQIYQVNTERDTDRIAFMRLESMPKFQGKAEPDSALYDRVFEGNVECKNLEEVYTMFNRNHPAGF